MPGRGWRRRSDCKRERVHPQAFALKFAFPGAAQRFEGRIFEHDNRALNDFGEFGTEFAL